MAQPKKRPSKTAKAAAKILSDSKLLANAKESADASAAQTFEAENVPNKVSAGIKPRPDKKRG